MPFTVSLTHFIIKQNFDYNGNFSHMTPYLEISLLKAKIITSATFLNKNIKLYLNALIQRRKCRKKFTVKYCGKENYLSNKRRVEH